MTLLLTHEESLVPAGGAAVCCSFALAQHSNKDAAGHAFHEFALLQAGVIGIKDAEEDDSAADIKSSTSKASLLEDTTVPEGVSWKGKKKKKKKDATKLDYYKLLGLENERWMATDNDIKLAYRKVALEKHPDKAGAGVTDEAEKEKIDKHFLQVQEAYDHLSDPAKRREFDSVDEFDDTLPESCAPTDFYKVFGPAFRRQARWSVQQPVPDLGGDDTPDREVDRFYKFWFGFKSWREFPHPDEEDVEQAESREDRRWIERFNAKLREKARKEEVKRLKGFVETAFNQDPRMVRRRQAEKAERDARKNAKEAAKRQQKEAAEAAAKAEAEAKAQAEAAAAVAAAEAKKARQIERKAMQKERSRIRPLVANAEGGRLLDDYDTEQLCEKLNLAQLQALRAGLETSAGARAAQQQLLQEHQVLIGQKVSEEAIAKLRAAAAAEAEAVAAKAREDADRMARLATWSDDEVRLLEKALVKFPVGTAKRWEQVAAYVRTRTTAEVIDMAKHGLKARSAAAQQKPSFAPTGKRAGTAIKSDATSRHEVFTDVSVNLAPSADTAANGAAANGGSGGAASPAGGASPAAASGPSDEWTEEQQLALVAAMKKYGKEVEDRWESIAAEVAGKTKAQCFKRFKELRQTFRAKKTG